MKNNLGITRLSHLEKIVKNLRKVNGMKDQEITFEYLCSSCFPTVWNNVKDALAEEYRKGYLDGEKAAKDDTNN